MQGVCLENELQKTDSKCSKKRSVWDLLALPVYNINLLALPVYNVNLLALPVYNVDLLALPVYNVKGWNRFDSCMYVRMCVCFHFTVTSNLFYWTGCSF